MLNIPKVSFQNAMLILTFIFLTMSEWLSKNGYIPQPVGSRHIILILVFIFLWLSNGSPKFDIIYIKKIGLLLFYIISLFFVTDVFLFNYLIGFIFTFIFLFIFLLSSTISIKPQSLINLFKYITYIMIILVLPSLIDSMNHQMGNLRNHPGVFREVGALGTYLNIGVITSLSLFLVLGKKTYLFISTFFTILIFSTILKKSIVACIVVWLIFFFYCHRYKLINLPIKKTILIFLVLIYFNYDNFIQNINSNKVLLEARSIEQHMRIGMYITSVDIAINNFPFGSGLGTFGSLGSIIGDYSFPFKFSYKANNLYYEYGLVEILTNKKNGLIDSSGMFLDTYYPHLIAELGILGFIYFMFIWLYPLRLSLKYINNFSVAKNPIYLLSFFVITIIISMLLEGFTLIQPEVPLFIFLHAGVSGLVLGTLRKENNRYYK
jgi:hypothetical protein